MHKRILVAYDGSLLSRKAIEAGKSLVAKDSEVHIISVLESPGPKTNVNLSRNISNELMEKYRPQMEKIKEEFERKDISVVTDILLAEHNENAGKFICEYAENQEIDLIIVGSRGLGKIRKILLGSVSSYVVQHAECPVLIMK